MSVSDDDDWKEVADARTAALARVLGPDGELSHAPHPFSLGGNADVLAFFEHLPGAVHVTAELTGKPDACYADYELMICHRAASEDWGPNVISRLAPYTQEAYIAAGETMDIYKATPEGSSITAFLFDTYGTFMLFDQVCEVRLCVGITKEELQFKMDHGPDQLVERLKRHDVYPFTDLERGSVPLGA